MLVLEIAAGVVLGGLVLGGLQKLPLKLMLLWLVIISICLLVLGAAILILVWAWNKSYIQTGAISIGFIAGLFLPPGLLLAWVCNKYPIINAAVSGTTPYNDEKKLIERLGIMSIVAISFAGVGVGSLLLVVTLVSYFFPNFK